MRRVCVCVCVCVCVYLYMSVFLLFLRAMTTAQEHLVTALKSTLPFLWKTTVATIKARDPVNTD